MRPLIAALAALVLSGCAAKADPQDVRCYAIGTVEITNDDPNPDDVALQAFYLGRLDQADPDGGWVEEFMTVMTKVELSVLLAEKEGCIAEMRQAMAKPKEALENDQSFVAPWLGASGAE